MSSFCFVFSVLLCPSPFHLCNFSLSISHSFAFIFQARYLPSDICVCSFSDGPPANVIGEGAVAQECRCSTYRCKLTLEAVKPQRNSAMSKHNAFPFKPQRSSTAPHWMFLEVLLSNRRQSTHGLWRLGYCVLSLLWSELVKVCTVLLVFLPALSFMNFGTLGN